MQKTLVINAVGLTRRLLGASTPRVGEFLRRGKLATISPVIPAVTCSAQATYLTGAWPGGAAGHGIVGNGWYFRDECEIKFWRQSSHLVQRPRIWEIARQRDPDFTCANVCWWHAMYSSADFTVTPRPMYLADGRKIPDIWTEPAHLRYGLQQLLGRFPLFNFWGPGASIESTRWIADAAILVDEKFDPTLTLVYLPHLDYVLQRSADPSAIASGLGALDDVIGRLIDHFISRGAAIVILSEYGIAPVSRPVHINRILRKLNLLSIREDELGREYLDAGDSQAFAVADHQIAHVYVNDRAVLPLVLRELRNTPGIAHVYEGDARRIINLDHPRSGELICLAEPDAWFTYYYWLDDNFAPDFARTVDIHRKSGYDPVELFTSASKLTLAAKLLKRKLGFRTLLDVIPLDATLVKGSHGVPPRDPADAPLLITSDAALLQGDSLQATDVFDTLLRHLFP